MSTILVVGATGHIGGGLVKLLAAQGAAVRAATRTPEQHEAHGSVTLVKFDIADASSYDAALDGVERMFLLPPNNDPAVANQMVAFIDAAQAAGVQQVVLSTAIGVDQAPDDSDYRRVELHLTKSGLRHTILRPNWFMQNFSDGFILPMIKYQQAIYLPAGDAAISFVDTADIAAVAAAALTEPGHDGREYTLTGPQALTHYEAAEVLSAAAGRRIQYEPIDSEAFGQALKAEGWYDSSIAMMQGLFEQVRAGYVEVVTRTISDVLGREPASFAEFAQAHASAWSAE